MDEIPIKPQPETPAYKYYAFISYSRKDSKIAAWLQKRLEWFRFPVKLVSEDRRPPNARYVRPIYRDKTNLEVTDEHYWTNIHRALEESHHLIVLCSPHSAASAPVEKEVAHFLATHGNNASLVVPIIISGNVTSTDADAALCPTLRELRDPLGDPLTTRNLPSMVPDAVTAEKDAWEHGFVALVSYLLRLKHSALGDHIQRETKRQKRVLWLWLVAVGVLALIALYNAYIAFNAERVAQEQRRTAQRTLAASDYLNARTRLSNDDSRNVREGCAYLARSIRMDSENSGAATRLLALLEETNFAELARRTPALDHKGGVNTVAFSPDGTRLATGSFDKTARVWDASTGAPLTQPLKHRQGVTKVSFSADGERLLIQTPETMAYLRDSRSDRVLAELKHDSAVAHAVFSPDGLRIATGTIEGQLCLWDGKTGERLNAWKVADLNPHEISVEELKEFAAAGITIDENGDTSFSSENNGKLPVPTKPIRIKRPPSAKRVHALCFSPSGEELLISCGNSVTLREIPSGKEVQSFVGHKESVQTVAFAPDGKRIATGSTDGTARIWNAVTGKELIDPIVHEDITDQKLVNLVMMDMDTVSHVEFSPDGKWLVTASANGEARVWDTATGDAVSKVMRHNSEIHVAHFSSDGLRIVTASSDSNVIVWDARQGLPLAGPFPHPDAVFDATFSPDGKRIASAASSWTSGGPSFAQIWDARKPAIISPTFKAASPLSDASMSDSGAYLAGLTADGVVYIWETATARIVGKPLIGSAAIRTVAFQPGGKKIATASENGELQIWDTRTSTPSGKSFMHPGPVCSLDWSPDGNRILSTCVDGSVRLWETSSCRLLGEFVLRDGPVKKASFTSKGREFLLSGILTSELRDGQTGRLIQKCSHPATTPRALCSSRSLFALDANDGQNAIQIWDARSGKSLGFSLTHNETYSQELDGQNWQVSTGVLSGEPSPIAGTTFSANGSKLLTWSSNRAARVWDTSNGMPVTDSLRHPAEVIDGDISEDGRQVVTICEKCIFLWDAISGEILSVNSFEETETPETVRFSPDGHWIIIKMKSGAVNLISHISTSEPVPLWMADFAEAMARRKVTETGAIVPVDKSPGTIISELRTRLQKDPAHDSWTCLGRWLLDDLGARSFSPFTTLPLRNYLQEAMREHSRAPNASFNPAPTSNVDSKNGQSDDSDSDSSP